MICMYIGREYLAGRPGSAGGGERGGGGRESRDTLHGKKLGYLSGSGTPAAAIPAGSAVGYTRYRV